ncbi:MAG TPA: hypothetical protein VGI99_01520 [Gemmataceae bacterium]|jgi:hypothetical protein
MRAIVFALRGCPAGWLGTYGNEWVATPYLDRVAAESIVFDQNYSDCPEPAAANRAWFADGKLLEELRAAGVRTVLVRANHPDTDLPDSHYAAWDEVVEARPQAEDAAPLDHLIRSLPSVLDKLATAPRWLIWIEIDRLLPPWEVPQDVFEAYIADEDAESLEDEEPIAPCVDPPVGPFDRTDLVAWDWLHGSFAAVVTALDAELGSIFEELRGRGLDQTATWILTSDLGYPLGEHGQVGVHRPWLHEELVHLPLIVRLPGAANAGNRIAGFTQPADVAELIREVALPVGSRLIENGSRRDSAFTVLECQGAKEVALRTSDWTFLLPLKVNPDDPPRQPLLFTRPDDRWEVNDVLSQHAEVAEQLKAECERIE